MLILAAAAAAAAAGAGRAAAASSRADALRAIAAQAAAGDAASQFRLGTLTYMGIGAEQDWAVAVDWLRRAASRGNAEAQCELGMIYQIGSDGVLQDLPQAVAWYRKAAAQGDAAGAFALAAMLSAGQGVARDEQQASALRRVVAASPNDLDAHVAPLATLYQHFLTEAESALPAGRASTDDDGESP